MLLAFAAGLSACVSDRFAGIFENDGVDPVATGSVATMPAGRTGPVPRIGIDAGITRSSEMYAATTDGGFSLPEVPYKEMDQRFVRRIVPDPTGEAPGTIVVDTANRYLYLVLPEGEAIRYGVGVGKEGFAWSGRAVIQYKKEWPSWTPPAEMVARKPELEKYSNGMPPGPMNPLGARAMYIFKDGRDTLFRIHGSPEWQSIGTQASSGCIRLINQDVIDLFSRVRPGSPVVVL
ncbi:MAG: L,D-transpeptidase [Nitratireductor sp.]|nr:L,D-transpeptidase [Nitratireductor sp.]